CVCCYPDPSPRDRHPFPTRRSSDLLLDDLVQRLVEEGYLTLRPAAPGEPTHTQVPGAGKIDADAEAARQVEFQLTDKGLDFLGRSEEHTSELQSRENLVCRLLLEKK